MREIYSTFRRFCESLETHILNNHLTQIKIILRAQKQKL